MLYTHQTLVILVMLGTACAAAPHKEQVRLVFEKGASIDYQALAKKYAPILVFNPLEKFLLADPIEFMRGSKLGKLKSGGNADQITDLGDIKDMSEKQLHSKLRGADCNPGGSYPQGDQCFIYHANWRNTGNTVGNINNGGSWHIFA